MGLFHVSFDCGCPLELHYCQITRFVHFKLSEFIAAYAVDNAPKSVPTCASIELQSGVDKVFFKYQYVKLAASVLQVF